MFPQLAACRFGRVFLHFACLLRGRHFRWHLRGIVRELGLAREGKAS